MTVPTITQCRHCTVPVAGGDLCTFCDSYVPPETVAQRLDVAVNRIDLLRSDINRALPEVSSTAPLMSVVDVVTALGYLRQAAVLLDRATDQLEAAEVQR